jgi:hypothetical protein
MNVSVSSSSGFQYEVRAEERFVGFSANKNIATYKVEDEKKKLTVEEMNA